MSIVKNKYGEKYFHVFMLSSDIFIISDIYDTHIFSYMFQCMFMQFFFLFIQIFKKESFLKTALDCGEVVWSRGLLRKGHGLCHGVSGNAYAFVSLYQETEDPRHIYRACKFAEWCINHRDNRDRIPDRPFSLFEGDKLINYFYLFFNQSRPRSDKTARRYCGKF